MTSLPDLASLRLCGRHIRIREPSITGKFVQATHYDKHVGLSFWIAIHSPATAGLKILVAGARVLCKRSRIGSNSINLISSLKFLLAPRFTKRLHDHFHCARNSAVHRTRNSTLMLPRQSFSTLLRSSTVRSRPFLSTQLLLFRHSPVTSKTRRCAHRVQAAPLDVESDRRCTPPETSRF
jgi:hypothetical protein